METVWICGEYCGGVVLTEERGKGVATAWFIRGVFATEEEARRAANHADHFVMQCPLGAVVDDRSVPKYGMATFPLRAEAT